MNLVARRRYIGTDIYPKECIPTRCIRNLSEESHDLTLLGLAITGRKQATATLHRSEVALWGQVSCLPVRR